MSVCPSVWLRSPTPLPLLQESAFDSPDYRIECASTRAVQRKIRRRRAQREGLALHPQAESLRLALALWLCRWPLATNEDD